MAIVKSEIQIAENGQRFFKTATSVGATPIAGAERQVSPTGDRYLITDTDLGVVTPPPASGVSAVVQISPDGIKYYTTDVGLSITNEAGTGTRSEIKIDDVGRRYMVTSAGLNIDNSGGTYTGIKPEVMQDDTGQRYYEFMDGLGGIIIGWTDGLNCTGSADEVVLQFPNAVSFIDQTGVSITTDGGKVLNIGTPTQPTPDTVNYGSSWDIPLVANDIAKATFSNTNYEYIIVEYNNDKDFQDTTAQDATGTNWNPVASPYSDVLTEVTGNQAILGILGKNNFVDQPVLDAAKAWKVIIEVDASSDFVNGLFSVSLGQGVVDTDILVAGLQTLEIDFPIGNVGTNTFYVQANYPLSGATTTMKFVMNSLSIVDPDAVAKPVKDTVITLTNCLGAVPAGVVTDPINGDYVTDPINGDYVTDPAV